MANLSKTRTVFAFTSPRTIEKIIPEIAILVENFSGQVWNDQSQTDFFEMLYASDFYQGRTPPEDKAFAARDRVNRAPKALGFVDIKPTISLTPAGERLLSGHRTSEIFAKQLFKFQLPSPFHKISPDRNFNVRPYLELVRMINELGSLSKTEIAIFFVQLTNYQGFDAVKESIVQFRLAVARTALNRDIFREGVFDAELTHIFAAEIEQGDLQTRESADGSLGKFLATKKSNQKDYADAFIRYLRATEYVTFERNTFRLIINPDRVEEVDFLLGTAHRDAMSFDDEREFKNYLFNPDAVTLLSDNPDYLHSRLQKIGAAIPSDLGLEDLKNYVEHAEEQKTANVIDAAAVALKNFQEFDDIIEVFQKISERTIPAPSLFLEWNVWRGFVMLNDAQAVQGNFKLDIDGVPLSLAPANKPDIEANYEAFDLIVEVTMSSGQTQFNMEGESVPRHFGNAQRNNDTPVYCIFVAPSISAGTLAHFFNLNKNHTDYYGGKTRIVPMNIALYCQFLTIAKEAAFQNSAILKQFLDSVIDCNQNVVGENAWFNFVTEAVPQWATA